MCSIKNVEIQTRSCPFQVSKIFKLLHHLLCQMILPVSNNTFPEEHVILSPTPVNFSLLTCILQLLEATIFHDLLHYCLTPQELGDFPHSFFRVCFQSFVSNEHHPVSCFPELKDVLEVGTGWDKPFAELIKGFSD